MGILIPALRGLPITPRLRYYGQSHTCNLLHQSFRFNAVARLLHTQHAPRVQSNGNPRWWLCREGDQTYGSIWWTGHWRKGWYLKNHAWVLKRHYNRLLLCIITLATPAAYLHAEFILTLWLSSPVFFWKCDLETTYFHGQKHLYGVIILHSFKRYIIVAIIPSFTMLRDCWLWFTMMNYSVSEFGLLQSGL